VPRKYYNLKQFGTLSYLCYKKSCNEHSQLFGLCWFEPSSIFNHQNARFTFTYSLKIQQSKRWLNLHISSQLGLRLRSVQKLMKTHVAAYTFGLSNLQIINTMKNSKLPRCWDKNAGLRSQLRC